MSAPENSVGAVCGSDGNVVVGSTRVCRVTNFTINASSSESVWGDSDSAGFTNRKKGRKDATGTITGKLDENQKPHQALFMPGDAVKLVLFENATEYWYFGRVLITNFTETFDQDGKEVVEWSADWGADGRYYRPGESGQPSETLPTS